MAILRNIKIREDADVAAITRSLEDLRTDLREDLQRSITCATQPYQTAITQMTEEFNNLVKILNQQDDEQLLCENIRLKLELQKKEMELRVFKAYIQPNRGLLQRLFGKRHPLRDEV